ncbi:MAG TPA: dienelactone hydrolase family protein [Steroidobacteraceae bacterium]|nr:dienelactone hydrolase family protein [Steroidobacteraceae bacterium]
MHTEILKYEADGLRFESHLYFDETKTGKRPAVLVFPEAFGLGGHAKSKARRLAELGYVALASDLHGEGKILTDMESLMASIGPLIADPSGTRARAKAGLAALVARPEVDAARIAAIGYCFGGTMALELARSGSAVVGVAGFHSGLGTARPQDAGNIKGKVLVCIGADDPMIGAEPREAFVQEMRAGGVDWQMELYGGVVHSFTNPEADKQGNPALKYDARADARSWAKLRGFLEEIFA